MQRPMVTCSSAQFLCLLITQLWSCVSIVAWLCVRGDVYFASCRQSRPLQLFVGLPFWLTENSINACSWTGDLCEETLKDIIYVNCGRSAEILSLCVFNRLFCEEYMHTYLQLVRSPGNKRKGQDRTASHTTFCDWLLVNGCNKISSQQFHIKAKECYGFPVSVKLG